MSYEWFHAVADRLTDALLLLSPEGDTLALNPVARRVLDNGGDAPVSLRELVQDSAALERYLALASRSDSPLPGSLRLRVGAGRWRCDASSASFADGTYLVLQLRSASEVVARFVTLNEQIDKLHAEIRRRELLEQEREVLLAGERRARAAAEDASRFKDELLASVSHELRTPLHAISGWLSLIQDNVEDRALLARGLEVIARNVAAESQLTEDLVDASLMVTGRMKLQLQGVDLEQVIRQAVDSARPAAEAKRQRIEVLASAGTCVVNGDPARLLQVVWNLLANATKHTPKGGRIQVVLRRVESHAEVSVSDTGEGIDAEVLPYVFDRFRRADGSSTRRHGGLGLGLTIVRHLVELHGGVVLAHSDGRDEGSTFIVSLPLPIFRHRRAATTLPNVDDQAAPKALAGLHVLLVEDHDDSRELLNAILRSEGAITVAVDSSAEAQRAFRERAPDIVVSDIEMPEEDGFTLMRKLRSAERELERVPVPAIAISAHTIGDARLHALRAGFQTFLPKPATPAELIATVASLCSGSMRTAPGP